MSQSIDFLLKFCLGFGELLDCEFVFLKFELETMVVLEQGHDGAASVSWAARKLTGFLVLEVVYRC